jgi:pyruvate,orthophosphate dikinase
LLLSVRVGTPVAPQTLVSYEESQDDTLNKHIIDMLGVPDSWSVPGVKESCLGLGMNDLVVQHLAKGTSERFAYNTYAHFLLRFGTLILGVPRDRYHNILSDFVTTTGRSGNQLTISDLLLIVEKFKEVQAVPSEPYEQLELAVREAYCFWFSKQAVDYRMEALDIDREVGVAIIVQAMVFGSVGLCFTRNPVTGEKGVFGSFWPSSTGCKYALSKLSYYFPTLICLIDLFRPAPTG